MSKVRMKRIKIISYNNEIYFKFASQKYYNFV